MKTRTAPAAVWAAGSIALLGLAVGACSDPDPGAPGERSAEGAWFEERAVAAGLDFRHVFAHEQHFWMPEISCGGLGLLDYDGDGWLDVYCVQSGDPDATVAPIHSNRLFRNNTDGTFTDVTEAAGVGDKGYGHGCATGDYDGDGDVDLYVANLRANVLYRNEGDGTFSDVTAVAGVAGDRFSTACAFTDYDRDGDLDLFVVNNINWSPDRELECGTVQAPRDYCSPVNYKSPSRDTLYRNEGDGTFTDVSEAAGILAASGIGLGLICADLNGDGFTDYYVANDSVPNTLWINDGQGHFTEQALALGAAVNMQGVPEASMGTHLIDIEPDGDWDLFMTHLRTESNTFYRNRNGIFSDATSAAGLAAISIRFTGFGLGFSDFDLDGHEDLFIANGRVEVQHPFYLDDQPYAEPNQLLRGTSTGRFEEVEGGPTGTELIGTSRAAAFGDLDNDGDVDVLYQDWGSRPHLLVNRAPRRGAWLQLRLLDGHGSDALGAEVFVRAGGREQHRICLTSYSYASANDPRVHFGLGPVERADEVDVLWADGLRERYGPLAGNRSHVLRRGEAAAVDR